jgi:hypothetical protein
VREENDGASSLSAKLDAHRIASIEAPCRSRRCTQPTTPTRESERKSKNYSDASITLHQTPHDDHAHSPSIAHSSAHRQSLAVMSVSDRADQFISQLCTALVSKLSSSSSPVAHSPSSLRSHLQSVIRALPTDGKAAALRTHLLDPTHLDEYVARLTSALGQAGRASAASDAEGAVALFNPRAFQAALGSIDRALEHDPDAELAPKYAGLLLPSTAPPVVHAHFVDALRGQITSKRVGGVGTLLPMLSMPFATASTNSALLEHLESLVLLARSLPLAHSSLGPLSSLIDRASLRFSSTTLDAFQERRFQNLAAMLLLEEAKRRGRDQWAAADDAAKYVARVRNILRKTGSTGFSGQYHGRLDPTFSCHALLLHAWTL